MNVTAQTSATILAWGCLPTFIVVFDLLIVAWVLIRLRRLSEANAMPVAQAQDGGLMVVSGRATGTELRSPLTGTPCIFWRVTVVRGLGNTMFTVFDRRSPDYFLIDDGSGVVQVQPEGAELFLDKQVYAGYKPTGPDPVAVRTALKRLGAPLPLIMRAYEHCLTSGDIVVAQGVVDCTRRPPVLASTGRQRLLLSDRPLTTRRSELYRTACASIVPVTAFAGCFAVALGALILMKL